MASLIRNYYTAYMYRRHAFVTFQELNGVVMSFSCVVRPCPSELSGKIKRAVCIVFGGMTSECY